MTTDATKVIRCRHGHVEGITPARFRGRAEIPLTPRGIAEAEALASRIAAEHRPALIYSSPLQRCMKTGEAIARATGAPVSPHGGLMDIDFGQWQWKTLDEVKHDDPAAFDWWFSLPWLMRFPGGECLQDLLLRTADLLRFVRERHAGQTVVLLGHESVNRALLLQGLAHPLTDYWRISQAPATANEFDFDAASVRIIRVDDASHLSDQSLLS